jgi:hypothetical protein
MSFLDVQGKFSLRRALDDRLEVTTIEEALQVEMREERQLAFEIDAGQTDLALDLSVLDRARYLVLRSSVCLGMRVNGIGNAPIVGGFMYLRDADIRSLHLTNKGEIYDEGVATGGDTDVLNDTSKSWAYSTLRGTVVAEPFDLGAVRFKIDLNGRSAVIALSGDGKTGDETAAAIQSAIDASGIGGGEVVVTWVVDSGSDGYLEFANARTGTRPIYVESVELDHVSRVYLGLFEPTLLLGDVSLQGMSAEILAGDGVGDVRGISGTFDRTSFTVTSPWSTQPAAGSEYRIYRPKAGIVTVLLGR